ncbi:MAG TPA: hypothetical protein VL244_15265 [Alphaproteobacteria bacterium]|nr:hypothetical protein [Alphaproteobacteria bacterium]
MNRLFLLHQGLMDRHSHYYGEALGWREACRECGVTLHLYVNRETDPALVAELSAVPAFPYATDVLLETDTLCQQLSDFITVSESFAQGCRALERDGIDGTDVAVVTYGSERDLYGAALWLERRPVPQRPSFVFIFYQPDFNWTIDRERNRLDGDFSRMRYGMKRLRAVLPAEKLVVYATTVGLAKALEPIIDYPCGVCPLPTYYGDAGALAASGARDETRVNVRLPGEFRIEKGAELVVPAILRIAELRPGITFALQIYREDVARFVAEKLAPLDSGPSRCVVEFGQLDHAEYQRRLVRSDIILLPYVWWRYALRSSGVFSEAVGFGLVTVVPNRTWMADCLQNGWGAGVAFGEPTVEDIAQAVLTALGDYPVLKEQAGRRSEEWRRGNCAAAVIDQIIRRTRVQEQPSSVGGPDYVIS